MAPRTVAAFTLENTKKSGVSALGTKPGEPSKADTLPSEEELTISIARLFAQELGLAEVDADSHFLFLGADSLNVERVMVAIGDRFSVNLATAAILDAPTPRELARMILATPSLPSR